MMRIQSIQLEHIYINKKKEVLTVLLWTGNTFLDNFHIDNALLYSTGDT